MSESIEQTLRKSQELSRKYEEFKIQQEKYRAESEAASKSLEESIQKLGATISDLHTTQNSITNFEKAFGEAIGQLASRAAEGLGGGQSDLKAVPGTPQEAADALGTAQRVLVLTGAGMSAGSGIRTFREAGGYWNEKESEEEDPKRILTLDYFEKHPAKCWRWLLDFYKVKAKAKPNAGHWALEKILQHCQRAGKNVTLVTQNIDSLHAEAHQETALQKEMAALSVKKKVGPAPGNLTYYEIHGNITKLRCQDCTDKSKRLRVFPTDFPERLKSTEDYEPPKCKDCGGTLRPHIMFFDEAYNEPTNGYDSVKDELAQSDCVVVIGTMLQTGLANSIVSQSISRGIQLLEINTNQEIQNGKTMTLLGKAETLLVDIARCLEPKSAKDCSPQAKKPKSPEKPKKTPEPKAKTNKK